MKKGFLCACHDADAPSVPDAQRHPHPAPAAAPKATPAPAPASAPSPAAPPTSSHRNAEPAAEEDAEAQEGMRVRGEIERGLGSMRVGDVWCAVASEWFAGWKRHVLYDGLMSLPPNNIGRAPPGKINNIPLLEDIAYNAVKPGLCQGLDYELVPVSVWNIFFAKYGGGPQICCPVIESRGKWNTSLHPDVRRLCLYVVKLPDVRSYIKVYASRATTLVDFLRIVCDLLQVQDSTSRLWSFCDPRNPVLLQDMEKPLSDLHVLDMQLIFVEKKKTDGSWPDSLPQDIAPPTLLPNTPSVSADTSNKSGWGRLFSGLYSKPPENSGLVGLVNLGNTCFMNSALQCLSNTVPLTDFFQQGLWRLDVNVNNPLGHKGVLAEAYAALLDELWRGENSIVAPRDFKKKVEKFAPQFSGYQQHDSVEFLNFLLDGLHEDLNRVKDKPYLPTIDLTGKSDEVAANEAWDWHLARNKSFIVDNFQGQLKSTVVCPQCGKVSITFDPVMYLSLPLVQRNTSSTRTVHILLHYNRPPSVSPDGETVVKYGVTVSSDSSVKDLKDCLSTLVGLPPYLLMLCDIQSSCISNFLSDKQSVDRVDEGDSIHAFHVSSAMMHFTQATVLIHHKRKVMLPYPHEALFGTPRPMVMPHMISYAGLCHAILMEYSPCLNLSTLSNYTPWTPSMTQEQLASLNPNFARDLFSIIALLPNSDTLTVLDPSQSAVPLSDNMLLLLSWKDPALTDIWKEERIFVHPTSAAAKPSNIASEVSLDTCLDMFTSLEKLGANDLWYCPGCKSHQPAAKKLDFWKIPPTLIVHLKRFKERCWQDKLDIPVRFPVTNLDMTKRVLSSNGTPITYHLYAVCNHFGGTSGGHYTAHALLKGTDTWCYFDDNSATKTSENSLSSTAAYVLFYQRD